MSIAEQAEQVLMLGFEGRPRRPVSGAELGAVLVRSENWTVGAAKALAERLAGEIPPAGRRPRRKAAIYRSFPDLPPPERELDIGRSESPDAALVWSQTTSKALADAGFDLNLFPVADVATLDSPLAGRAFSDDPAQVAALTEEAIQGCEDAGIACAPAPLPGARRRVAGHGRRPGDRRPRRSRSSRTATSFRSARSRRTHPRWCSRSASIRTSTPSFPGAMTEGVATGLLRDEIGFKGVAISDDLGAGAVSRSRPKRRRSGRSPPEPTSSRSHRPRTPTASLEAIEQAVEDGEIEPERLAEAAERVRRRSSASSGSSTTEAL